MTQNLPEQTKAEQRVGGFLDAWASTDLRSSRAIVGLDGPDGWVSLTEADLRELLQRLAEYRAAATENGAPR